MLHVQLSWLFSLDTVSGAIFKAEIAVSYGFKRKTLHKYIFNFFNNDTVLDLKMILVLKVYSTYLHFINDFTLAGKTNA